jgi:hypothetical protein
MAIATIGELIIITNYPEQRVNTVRNFYGFNKNKIVIIVKEKDADHFNWWSFRKSRWNTIQNRRVDLLLVQKKIALGRDLQLFFQDKHVVGDQFI